MIRVRIPLDAPDDALDAYGAGALIRVERSATEDGVFAEVDTVDVVDGTYLYELDDTDGLTSSWYRWRLSNAANDDQGEYSDPFQGETFSADAGPVAYATLDDFSNTFQQDVSRDNKRAARALAALIAASRQIDRKLGFSFQQTALETRYFTTTRADLLCVHDGIADPSTAVVEISTDNGATFASVTAGDYVWGAPVKSGFPTYHLRFTRRGTVASFPIGVNLVRVTGRFGWPAVPADVTEACIARTRQLVQSDPTLQGIVGPEELGRVMATNRMPDAMYQLTRDYSAHEVMEPCWL